MYECRCDRTPDKEVENEEDREDEQRKCQRSVQRVLLPIRELEHLVDTRAAVS